MKYIDYFYAAFYAVSFENLPIGRKNSANVYASFVVGITIAGWLNLIVEGWYHALHKTLPENFDYVSVLLAVFCYGLIYWLYSRKERYFKVYQDYKVKHKLMSRATFILLGILLIGTPFFILVWI